MNAEMAHGRTITLWQQLGPIVSVVVILGALLLVGLLVATLIRRARGKPTAQLGWWLRSFAVWMFMFGVVSYSGWLMMFHSKIGLGGFGNPELLHANLGEACAKLACCSFLALMGWTFGLIAGNDKDTGAPTNPSSSTS